MQSVSYPLSEYQVSPNASPIAGRSLTVPPESPGRPDATLPRNLPQELLDKLLLAKNLRKASRFRGPMRGIPSGGNLSGLGSLLAISPGLDRPPLPRRSNPGLSDAILSGLGMEKISRGLARLLD